MNATPLSESRSYATATRTLISVLFVGLIFLGVCLGTALSGPAGEFVVIGVTIDGIALFYGFIALIIGFLVLSGFKRVEQEPGLRTVFAVWALLGPLIVSWYAIARVLD